LEGVFFGGGRQTRGRGIGWDWVKRDGVSGGPTRGAERKNGVPCFFSIHTF
jgi:hypothetical protein